MCALLGVDGVGGFKELLKSLIGETVTYTREEIWELVEIAAEPAIKKRNAKPITREDIFEIYCAALCREQ